MKSASIGVFAVLFSLGLAAQAAAAERCVFTAGAGIDATSPSQLGSLECFFDEKLLVKKPKQFAVLAVWGSDPYTTGASARVQLQLRDKITGAIQTFEATTGWAPKTNPSAVPKLNDVKGAFGSGVLTITFRFVVAGTAQAVNFKVSDFVGRVD